MEERFIAGIKRVLSQFIPARRLSRLSAETRIGELIDSVDMVEFITRFEDTFQISLSTDELVPENFKNVAAMVQLLEVKKAETSGDDPLLST